MEDPQPGAQHCEKSTFPTDEQEQDSACVQQMPASDGSEGQTNSIPISEELQAVVQGITEEGPAAATMEAQIEAQLKQKLAATLRPDVILERAIAQEEALQLLGRAHLSRKQRKEWQADIDERVFQTVSARYEAAMQALIAASRAHPDVTSLSELETTLALDLDFAEKQRAKGGLEEMEAKQAAKDAEQEHARQKAREAMEEVARQEREKKRQAKQAALDAEREQARQKEKEAMEEAARQERQAKRAAIDAEHERAKQKEKEERERLRREMGLASDGTESQLVHARCALRQGGHGSLLCPKATESYAIRGLETYVIMMCTSDCKMHFHHGCYKEVERALKGAQSQWKLKRGVACMTEGCPGTISYCALQQGSEASPLQLTVLVQQEKEDKAKEKERHPKPKRRDDSKKHHKQDTQQPSGKREDERPQRQDLNKTFTGEGPASPAAAAGPIQLQASPPKTKPTEPMPPAVDIASLDFASLRPVPKHERDFDHAAAAVERAKREKEEREEMARAIREHNLQYADLEPHWELEEDDAVHPVSMSSATAPASAAESSFFDQLNKGWETSQEPPVNTSRAAEFPNLLEASLADDHPDLFKYISNVQDLVSSLRLDDAIRATNTLLMENLDLEFLTEQGQVAEAYLKAVLADFGGVEKFRCFEFLGLACVQYSTPEQASAAMAALHEGVIGRRETRMCYMRLFPSDVLLKHRLGPKVWQMYATSEADLASRSKAQAQEKERQRAAKEKEAQEKETAARELRLNAAAQAFKPPTSSTAAAAAPEEPVLQEQLAQFQATEVIGCNSNSLQLYLEDGEAFGVLPPQLVNHGYGSTPTALIMSQMDMLELHGIWRTAGRQNANGQQVVAVKIVEGFKPLKETVCEGLLVRDEEGFVSYPQALDADKTQALMRLFHASTAEQPAQGAAQTEKPGIVSADEAEALQLLAQAQADEELARQLQQEMDREGPVATTKTSADEQIAQRLQAEEAKAATPSYSSAVRRDTYTIPVKRPTAAPGPPPPAASQPGSMRSMFPGLFSELCPAEAPSPPPPLPQPQYSQRQSSPTASWRSRDAQEDNVGWDSQDAGFAGGAWGESLSQGSGTGISQLSGVEGWATESNAGSQMAAGGQATSLSNSQHQPGFSARPPAYRPPLNRSPPPAVRATQPVAPASNPVHNDILAILLGTVPQESPAAQTLPAANLKNTRANESTMLHQTGSSNSLSSLESGSERIEYPRRSAAKASLCCICNQNPANYIARPCKHWGPCISCVPSAVDKNELYPTCLRCNTPNYSMIRVYER